MRLTGRLLVCMAVLAGASQVAPSHAQQTPASPPGAIKPHNAAEPARTPKERGARTSGRFAKDDTLNLTTQKIRKDGAGPCDTVNTAVDSGADRRGRRLRWRQAFVLHATRRQGMDLRRPAADHGNKPAFRTIVVLGESHQALMNSNYPTR